MKLTKAQRALLEHIGRHAGLKTGRWILRDMRRYRALMALDAAGLIDRDAAEAGAWPHTVRIETWLTDAGRQALEDKES